MHNALAVLLSIFFFSTSSSIALSLPSSRDTLASRTTPPAPADKCSFTLWHKQLCTAATKANYIQINQLEDHNNDIIIDLAALRPVAARNSYSRISDTQVFAIEGLLDDKTLTIRSEDGHDEVMFDHDGVQFSSDVTKNGEEAWCVAGAWDSDSWECGSGSRVSQDHYFF
jgi:hypothetical protein